jgi:hypothetical protein
MAHHSRIRWYNPKLEDFEWRTVPRSDEEVLKLLDGCPYSQTCKETYAEWRKLGATITVALIRARQPYGARRTVARGTGAGGPLRRAVVLPGGLFHCLRYETPAAEECNCGTVFSPQDQHLRVRV